MCCASAALPPLPQSKTLLPLLSVLQIISPARSISSNLVSSKVWMDFKCSSREWARSVVIEFSDFGNLLSTLNTPNPTRPALVHPSDAAPPGSPGVGPQHCEARDARLDITCETKQTGPPSWFEKS